MHIARAAIAGMIAVACTAFSSCSNPSPVSDSNTPVNATSSQMAQAPVETSTSAAGWHAPEGCPAQAKISSLVGRNLTLDSPNSDVCFYMSADNDAPISIIKMPGSVLSPNNGSSWPRVSMAEDAGVGAVEVRDESTNEPTCAIQVPTSTGFYSVTATGTSLDVACGSARRVLASVAE